MRAQDNSAASSSAITLDEVFARTPSDPGVLVADGYGLSVSVTAGHLVISDGIGEHRRVRRLPRSERTVRRIVVLGKSGSITLDAFRWCNDVGSAVVAVDPEMATLLTYNAPTTHEDARLRRAQALAPFDGTGVAVAKTLLDTKLTAQADVARRHLDRADIAEVIDRHREALRNADNIAALLQVEANAAALYFGVWTGVTATFVTSDRAKVPDEWLTFDHRTSALANHGSPRSATNPVNALLNYCYRLAEIEATLACHTLGLDPALGVLHVDKAYRASLALDVIETVRPAVDAYVLDLIASHTFRRADFHQTRDGRCRVLAPLTHTLAETMPTWAQLLAPHIEAVAHAFAANAAGALSRRTPLTGKPRSSPRRTKAPATAARPAPRCTRCGGDLGDRRRAICRGCFEGERLDVARDREFQARRRLDDLLMLSTNPATKPDGNTMRSAKASWTRCANDLWTLENPDDERSEADYRSTLLPRIVGVPIQVIAERLGVAQDAAWRIREGRLLPHKRHWAEIAAMQSM